MNELASTAGNSVPVLQDRYAAKIAARKRGAAARQTKERAFAIAPVVPVVASSARPPPPSPASEPELLTAEPAEAPDNSTVVSSVSVAPEPAELAAPPTPRPQPPPNALAGLARRVVSTAKVPCTTEVEILMPSSEEQLAKPSSPATSPLLAPAADPTALESSAFISEDPAADPPSPLGPLAAAPSDTSPDPDRDHMEPAVSDTKDMEDDNLQSSTSEDPSPSRLLSTPCSAPPAPQLPVESNAKSAKPRSKRKARPPFDDDSNPAKRLSKPALSENKDSEHVEPGSPLNPRILSPPFSAPSESQLPEETDAKSAKSSKKRKAPISKADAKPAPKDASSGEQVPLDDGPSPAKRVSEPALSDIKEMVDITPAASPSPEQTDAKPSKPNNKRKARSTEASAKPPSKDSASEEQVPPDDDGPAPAAKRVVKPKKPRVVKEPAVPPSDVPPPVAGPRTRAACRAQGMVPVVRHNWGGSSTVTWRTL
ncbi:hypothetical protein BDZ88DRAFT_413177 [Geranomyces variabilis]|nr:hypothetical protein BDZ88DRAFT_413177 [Geranomyces variabilis]KAJ3136812.1 hypothetical protein HDU90_002377 [Geranomyces variabilis]